jgi:hypothetical protein
MEQLETSLSALRKMYNKNAANRNEIVKPAMSEIQKIIGYSQNARGKLANQTSPEDNNRSIGME